jgi:hypothetical protein
VIGVDPKTVTATNLSERDFDVLLPVLLFDRRVRMKKQQVLQWPRFLYAPPSNCFAVAGS